MTIWVLITEAMVAFNSPLCFHRTATFTWFVIATLGIMVRSDDYGIASCIRSIGIAGQHYGALDNFFHSLAFELTPIRACWHGVVSRFANLHTLNGAITLLIDHTKKAKEGRRMPGVRKLFQESETQSKPEYIHGYMYGGLSVVASKFGNPSSIVAIPLILQLQNGISYMLHWLDMCCDKLNDAEKASANRMKRAIKDLEISTESNIVQMVSIACRSAQWLKRDANIVADRAFLTLKALNTVDVNNNTKPYKVQLVTRCKKNLAVYSLPKPRAAGARGRASKKGDRLYFDKLFSMSDDELQRNIDDPDNHSYVWSTKTLSMYGKNEEVTFVALNLVWAKAKCRVLRFVLVKYNEVSSILVTTDLSMSAETVIQLYCTRERIESTFRELNQCVNAFSSRFWTSSMPKLNYFRRKTDPDPLEEVKSANDREKVALTVRAIELYAALSCIAMGLIQIISLIFVWTSDDFRWQRTPTDLDRPSEACIQNYLKARITEKLLRNTDNSIGSLIHDHLDKSVYEEVEKMMNVA